jgi:glycosyltransferase involved in cell wall biosynthesis
MIVIAMNTLKNKSRTMNPNPRGLDSGAAGVSLVIPAYNEEDVIGQTLLRLPSSIFSQILVADNGSTDQTAQIAARSGAKVLSIPERGYGAACLAALDLIEDPQEILIFLQADCSEDASEASLVLAPLLRNEADLVIGSRVLGQAQPGALRPHQRFGNWLATSLIHFFWGVRFTDLGPFRALRAGTLRQMAMRERSYGWTVEMQVRAAQMGLRVAEVPVSSGLRLAGTEKVSGNWQASLRAGGIILSTIFRLRFFNK